MTLKQKLVLGTGAVALAVIGVTGALASGRGDCSGVACPKSDCAKECPCAACPDCPGC